MNAFVYFLAGFTKTDLPDLLQENVFSCISEEGDLSPVWIRQLFELLFFEDLDIASKLLPQTSEP